jgi:hypothetical protein
MTDTGADIDLDLNAGPPLADPMLDSLYRRMRTMHSLYYQAVDTMDLEHVNHFEREGVLPIAFSLFHYTNVHDGSFMMITGEPPIWNDEWQQRVQLTIADHGKHKTVEEMVAPAHRRLRRVQGVPAGGVRPHRGVPAHDGPCRQLTRVLIAKPYPPMIATTYSARCAGPQGITVLDGSSAGSTSTACATWARSNWPAAWSASGG